MADLVGFRKVVSALPGTLVADTLYYVRVGSGFDTYLTNSAGTIVAYKQNIAKVVTDYRSAYNAADDSVYAGYLLDSVIVISKTNNSVVEFATGLTDIETDWTNRLTLTYA